MDWGYHSVNASTGIVWVDGSGNTHTITKVVYSDNYGSTHTIWPCSAQLTDVYITELKRGDGRWDIKNRYTLDSSGDPSYYLKPSIPCDHDNPNDPETLYAITGTVVFYKEPGVIDRTVENCYFFAETIENVPGDNSNTGHIHQTGHVPKFGDRLPDDGTGVPIHTSWTSYAEWYADETPGHVSPISVQVGWYGGSGYIQNGFIFDKNYATPFILKRADIYRHVRMYRDVSETGNSTVTPGTLQVGSSLTFVPKLYATADHSEWDTEWSKYTLDDFTIDDIVYDPEYLSVSINSTSHTITLTAIKEGNTQVTLRQTPETIIDPVSGQSVPNPLLEFCPNYTFSLTCLPEYIYRITQNGTNPIQGAGITVTGTSSVLIQQCHNWASALSPAEYVWETFTGTATIESSDTSVFTVSDGSTADVKKFTPDLSKPAGSSATITIRIGSEALTFEAIIGEITTYYKVGNNTAQQLLSNMTNDIDFSRSQMMLAIAFTSDQSGTNPRPVYVQAGEMQFSDGVKLYGSYNSYACELDIASSGTMPSVGATYEFPVYVSQGGTLLGTIKITIRQ